MFSKGLLLSPPVPVCPYLTDAAPHTNQPIHSFGVTSLEMTFSMLV